MRRYIYIWGVLLITVIMLVLSVGVDFQQWKSQLGYYFKHAPLCWAENVGWIPQRRAHHVEELGDTVDILRCTPTQPPKLTGRKLRHDLVVVSDLGGVVQRISSDGNLLWQRRFDLPRGIAIDGNRLFVGEGKYIRILSLDAGIDLAKYKLDQSINNIRLLGNDLFILMDVKGIRAVRHYDLTRGAPILVKASSFETSFARGLHIDSSGVYVADTYNHRILRLGQKSLEVLDQTHAWYPMSLQNLGDNLLVVEDLNVVSEFGKNPLKRLAPRAGCRRQTALPELKNEAGFVFCDRQGAEEELYSPNDAILMDDYVYVADTHSHRIAVFYDGQVVAQLTGFNNPVNVLPIRQ